jgi:Uma2 family endonuclease
MAVGCYIRRMADTAQPFSRPANQAEFRTWESAQLRKHEFRGGQVRMMTGARKDHNQIALNIAASLKHKLQGLPCRPFANDLMVETDVEATYYPDVVVDCGPHAANALVAATPTVVFEVLSPTTRNGDFAEKVPDYRDTASIQQIVLVEAEEPRLHVWTRGNTEWRESSIGPDGARLNLPSLGVELTFAEIYEGVFD